MSRLRYSCDQYREREVVVLSKLTFKIEEKIGLLFQICASQNFQEVPHVTIPAKRERGREKINRRGHSTLVRSGHQVGG